MNILKKREYLGHTINFKTRKHFKDKKSHYVSEDKWTIFENTHEAIIDQQTFDLAQKIRSNVRRYPNGWGEAAPLTGLLYCADCGGKMYVHRTNNGKRVSQYTCSNYTKVPCGTLCPTQHRINESAVLTLVSDTLRAIAEYSRNDRTEFIHTVQETQVAQQSADISKKRRRLAAAQKRAGELEKLICKIYEDNALGKLPDARYRALDAQYAKEQDALEIEIAELEKAVTGYEQSQKSAEKFIALIDKYENFDTLTNTMLNEFVEKILVHERARKGSQDTTQEIEIYFNFLGRYTNAKHPQQIYSCKTYNAFGKNHCTQHRIDYDTLYSHVLRKIRECARAALMDGEAVADRLTNTCEAEQREQREAMERSLTRDEERIEVLDKMVMRLYEDMIAGRISEQNFNTMLEKTQTEQTELKTKVSEGRKRLSDEVQLANDAKQWVEAIQEYANITELDAATLNRLIKEIVVHERIDEDKTRHISIEIHFNLKPIPEVEQVTA